MRLPRACALVGLGFILAFPFSANVFASTGKLACQDQQQEDDTEKNPAQQIDDVIANHEARMAEFMQEYRSAKPEDRQKLIAEKMPKPAAAAEQLMGLAAKHPKDPAAVTALLWIVSRARGTEQSQQALTTLLRDHVEDERLGDIVMNLSYNTPGPDVEQNLRQIISQSPHDSVKGIASYGLGQYLSRVGQYKGSLEDPRMVASMSEESVQYIKDFQPDPAAQEALYQTIIDQYAEVPYRKRKLGKMAEGALFEIRYLGIGKTVPEIEGEDLDGEAFQLSDYRGKVVVLDFWGDW